MREFDAIGFGFAVATLAKSPRRPFSVASLTFVQTSSIREIGANMSHFPDFVVAYG